MKRAFAVITVMVMIFGITAFAGGTVIRAAAYDDDDRIALWQENKEVPYDGRYWIQPNEWNCFKIDSRDYEGGIMIFFDKIGLYPEYAKGKVQRVYVSVVGAQEPVSMMKFHIFYDKRLVSASESTRKPSSTGTSGGISSLMARVSGRESAASRASTGLITCFLISASS